MNTEKPGQQQSGAKGEPGTGTIICEPPLLREQREDALSILLYISAGKPEFSLSHSHEHVLLGVSDELIGVDMERKDRRVNEAVRRRMCLPQEKELDPLQIFTRKECAMKLTGLGFSLPLQEIDTTIDYRWQGKSYRFYTTEAEGYLISVLSADTILPEIQLLTVQELL